MKRITFARIFNTSSLPLKINIVAVMVLAVGLLGVLILGQRYFAEQQDTQAMTKDVNMIATSADLPTPKPSNIPGGSGVASPKPSSSAQPKPSGNPSPSPAPCLRQWWGPIYAKGNISILVVPAYFPDVVAEYANHAAREQVYRDAFAEINTYLATIQQQQFGKQLMTLQFTLAQPIQVTGSPTEYEQSSDKILSAIKASYPEVDSGKYHIVVMRALTTQASNYSGYNFGTQIWANQNWGSIAWMNQTWSGNTPIPESVALIQQQDQYALHLYRGFLTSLMLHEVMHSFGTSDTTNDANEGGRANRFYEGVRYDGTQPLLNLGLGSGYEDVTANRGIFQDFSHPLLKEIGWTDENRNGKIDIEEVCASSNR